MRNLIVQVALCVYLLGPLQVRAAEAMASKDPFSYSLKQYGLVLSMSLLGGFVSWFNKVRKGETDGKNLMFFVGEMTTAAFAGLGAFYVCEWMNLDAILTPAVVGIAGHMGTKLLTIAEEFMRRWAESRKL